MEPIITLKNVGVCYDRGKSNETQALKDITVDIFPGEYIVFFGPSGCGKSTLLYTIAGLEQATEGSVLVKGNELTKMGDKEKIAFYRDTIGMVFQAFYLVPHLSAKDNMMLSKMFSGIPSREREARAEELMERFGITSFADHKPSMLSGGQQQRTAIARALMNDPEIVLADEPVGNLDSKNAQVVLELLSQINREEKKTVIQVTHNPQDTHYADRVFHMKDGVIERIAVNTPEGRKVSAAHDGELTEFEKMRAANPGLSDIEVSARFIMRSLLSPYDIETEQKIEVAVARYLTKDISADELVRVLDDQKTGAGLYAQKARHLAHDIEKLAQEVQSLARARTQDHGHETEPFLSQAVLIRQHLLDTYQGTFSREDVHLLDEAIAFRLDGRIDAQQLFDVLNEPRRRGGLGLNRATAKRFAKHVELVLSQQL